MIRILGVIGVLLWTGLAFGQIRVSESVQHLGDIFENRGRVTTKFTLENPYREDTIRIVDIETSCGCTAVLSIDSLILPASSISIDVSYDPKGRLGLFVKSVEIRTQTGPEIQDKLFLKIMGNVVSESYVAKKNNNQLLQYSVAPIYFYPITAYDTSYLDYNFITDFVNDLTYEVDFYQFATIGIEVEVGDIKAVEGLEYLMRSSREKVMREFNRRGFNESTVFFDEPVFKISTELPPWANGAIRLYSVNFDATDADTSAIKVSATEEMLATKMLLDYERFALPEIEKILNEVNFETIEGKLFLNGELNLKGTILMPWKKSSKTHSKTASKLTKAIQKRIKETTGATKKEVHISFDSLSVHPDNKFHFQLWDEADEEGKEIIRYVLKPDKIVSPQLPTYKQYYEGLRKIDTASLAFKQFWSNCLMHHKKGEPIKLLLESSLSTKRRDFEMDNIDLAWIGARALRSQLEKKFRDESGGGEIEIEIKGSIRGPKFDAKNPIEDFDYSQFDFFTIIPLVHLVSIPKTSVTKPYMVNFDYYFKGIDTGAYGFQVFAAELAETVRRDGYVELRMESSISKIPIEHTPSNLNLAYSRLFESQKRLKAAMAIKLVDPNRIIFTDALVVEQGPAYDGSIPILQYRKFHYIRIVPEKSLK